MSTVIYPALAKFTVELAEFMDKLFDKYSKESDVFYETFEPEIRLYTVDGLTAKFFEEGIEFYPDEKEPERKTFTGDTLGDIAEVLREMKAAGMTRESVVYAMERVYYDEGEGQ